MVYMWFFQPLSVKNKFGRLLTNYYHACRNVGLPVPLHSFDQRRVDIFDQVECGVHDRLHIYPLCGIFYFPGIDTGLNRPTIFNVYSERHWQIMYFNLKIHTFLIFFF